MASMMASRTLAQSATSAASTTLAAILSVESNAVLATLPPSYVGLSYESAQLANPQFFSASNQDLIELIRGLSAQGVLRIGGGTSAFTTFSATPPSGAPPFEVFGPDTSKTEKTGTITTALALQNLRAFLDAAGWSCLYGLNLARGTKENSAAEADAAHRILGPRLLALQIGNEPDSFRNRYRPAAYGPQDFLREWLEFRAAIVQRVPNAKFAGPDISNKLDFLTAFAEEARHHPDVILLTGHYYAMGPAGSPAATLDNLLSEDPKSATLKWSKIPVVQQAMRSSGLPFRLSEANSCWNGGQPGVSDVFASALWCADAMLRFASLGFCGINLHGGGNGIYSPIVGSPSAGFTRQPEYFGIEFAGRFAGATMVQTRLQCASDRVTAYAGCAHPDAQSVNKIAIINKTLNRVNLQWDGAARQNWTAHRLTAPSIEARDGVTIAEAQAPFGARQLLTIAPYSAVLLSD